MNRRSVISSMVVGAAAAATVGVASAADKQIEIYVDHWKKSKDLTIKVANTMPAENYDYKPFVASDAAPSARSYCTSVRARATIWVHSAKAPRRKPRRLPMPPNPLW